MVTFWPNSVAFYHVCMISSHQSPPQPYQKIITAQQQSVFSHTGDFFAISPATISAMVDASPPSMSKCRRLVLHFDVNETIMVGDPASNINFGQSLNNLLAKVAFFQDAGICLVGDHFSPFGEDVFVISCPCILSRWWFFTYFWSFHPETWGNVPIWLYNIFQMACEQHHQQVMAKIQGCQGYPLARRLPGEPRPTRARSIDGTTSVAHLLRGGTAVAQMLRGPAARSEVAGKQVYRKRLPGPLGVLMLISSGSWHTYGYVMYSDIW